MSDTVRRQLQQRLESLRLAGVEFLPLIASAPPAVAIQPAREVQPEPSVSAPAAAAIASRAEPATEELQVKRMELKLLAERVAKCVRCPELSSTRTQTVFGVGAIEPDLCFIGEAPGADEDRQGEPFVGLAGQLLNRIIAAMGMKREEVYICNILRCRPPGNRPPQVAEADNCREWLESTLKLVRPRHICCLGASAAKFLLKVNLAIGKMRKRFFDYEGIPVLCTYHPSYLLRLEEPAKTKSKAEVWDDMKMLLGKMGRPIPVVGERK